MKKLALVILFFVSNTLFSQESPNIKIGIKDNHFSKITSAIATKEEKQIISADETGKIILLSTADYGYLKTIRESSGIPIQDMRLAKNDELLMITQKIKYSNGSADSLLIISLKDNKILLKEKRNCSFLGKLKNDVIISNTTTNYSAVIECIDQDFNKLLKFETDKTVTIAEITEDKKMVIYTEGDYLYAPQNKIVTRAVETGAITNEIAIPEGIQVSHLFFDLKAESFYAVCYIESKKAIRIYKGKSSINWSNPIFEMPFENYSQDTLISDTVVNNAHNIIFTSNSALYQKPILLTNNGDQFYSSTLFSNTEDINKTASLSLLLHLKKEIVFFQVFNPNFTDIVGFHVFDLETQKIIGDYPKTTSGFYTGNFLTNDHWMVMKRNDAYTENIKFYAAGTYKNRYDQLSIKNYIQVKHALESIGKTYLDKQNGLLIFEGRDRDKVLGAVYSYYKYDLINDKIYKLYDSDKKYFSLIDYNTKNNSLLCAVNDYTNESGTPSQMLVKSATKNVELSDTFKFGKFSKNGDYLLTINKDDIATIRLISDDKILFNKQLAKGSYQIFAIDASTFIITNTLRYKNKDANCYFQTLILEVKEGKVTEQITDCALISDVSFQNENIAMILNNNVVVVNDKPVLFKGLEFPLEISFNSDASKFMISFKNGSIVIYDTKTLEELGRMIHPNEKSHVFVDNKGHYFSNIDADQYLWATQDNQPVSLKSIEKESFSPEKLLSIFGTPNKDYLMVLEKAKTIREEAKINTPESSPQNSTQKPKEETGKPDLYLISIGVSEYLQSDYNLTFADKDALDITKIYGSLSDAEFNAYKDKFFGNKFTLHNKKGDGLKSIPKYLGTYKSEGDFFNTGEENSWVELQNGKINLWNFDAKTVVPITVPADFTISSYSVKDSFFPVPDGSGFSVIGNDGAVFSNNILNKKSKTYQFTNRSYNENHTLIKEDEWLLFDYEHVDSTSTISIAVFDGVANKTTALLKINPHYYQERTPEGAVKNIAVENSFSYIIPKMRAVSSNGNYLLYSTDDESLFRVDLTQTNPIPFKIRLAKYLHYGTEISIANDGKTICLLNDENNTYTATLIDNNGNQIESQTIDNKDYSIKGVTIQNTDLKWIKATDQLVEDSYFESEYSKLLNDSLPFSFDKIHTLNLINQNANAKSIKSSLLDFFKNTKSNDQVMVFMAGHGMLDEDNNYYFAPHDMDFEKPKTNGIAFEFIVNCLKNVPAKNKLLLLDSCHSGTTLDMTASKVKPTTPNPSNNQRGSGAIAVNQKTTFKVSEVISSLFDNFLSTSGVTILSASSGYDVAFEYKKSGNGAFTASYIELLMEKMNSRGYLQKEDFERSIDLNKEFITDFFKKVMISTDNKQVPDIREINDNATIKLW
jgi:hypothetical protein